jgi:hypothetical protein
MKKYLVILVFIGATGCQKKIDVDPREQYLGRYAYTQTTDYPGPYNRSTTQSGSVTLSLGTNTNSIRFSENGDSREATLDGANFHFDPSISSITSYTFVTTSVGQFIPNGFNLTQTSIENNSKTPYSIVQLKAVKP